MRGIVAEGSDGVGTYRKGVVGRQRGARMRREQVRFSEGSVFGRARKVAFSRHHGSYHRRGRTLPVPSLTNRRQSASLAPQRRSSGSTLSSRTMSIILRVSASRDWSWQVATVGPTPMSTDLPALDRRPEARSETIEDLVRFVREGRVRIPSFQRPLRWETQQVLDFFDSIYRGYPVGSLLVSKRHASADRFRLGPMSIDAPELTDAWWVVDGQQRLTSLAVALARPEPIPDRPEDPFVVYFDALARSFRPPPSEGPIPDWWVPLPLLLDAARLSEWMTEWPHRSEKEKLRTVFEAGKRIREYKLPMYLLETEDVELLKEIFFRVNNSGRPLDWNEVHDALYGREDTVPSTITQLAADLAQLGMGRPSEEELTSVLLAIRGLDVTRPLAEHRRKDRDVLRGAVADAVPVLRRTFWFLRTHGAIPHLRLLPRILLIEVLSRFFTKHPDPNPRSLELLTRWVWRTLLAEGRYDERTLRRHGVAAVGEDEEGTVQSLLRLVPREPVEIPVEPRFDARSARTRLALLALSFLSPRDIEDGQPVDVAGLLEKLNVEAFRIVVRITPTQRLTRSTANRVLHLGEGSARRALADYIASESCDYTILRTHAISRGAARALARNDYESFLRERQGCILETLSTMGNKLAGWGRRDRDRPSIAHILSQSRMDDEQAEP